MSFSDMMQSGRGPGVIGMLLALLVLGGFSVLFLLAFNEDPAGANHTPEAIIFSQDKDIAELKAAIKQRNIDLEPLSQRKAVVRKLEDIQLKLRVSGDRMPAIQEEFAGLTSRISALENEFMDYQNRYREFARSRAKGEKLGTFTTLKGSTYQKAIIREINPVGVRITYDDGAGGITIPYEELPAEMQDRFQFDPGQRDEFLAGQADEIKTRNQNLKKLRDEKKDKEEDNRRIVEAQLRENTIRAIAVKSARIAALDTELIRLEGDLRREMLKKLRNTNAIKSKMTAAENERNELRRQVAELNASL